MKLILKSILTHKYLANFLALLVTILMLGLTFAYLYGQKTELDKRHARAFDVAVEHNYAAIRLRLTEMAVILRGVKGYFEASDYVTQKEYHDYFTALALGEHLSGFQGVAVATSVSKTNLPRHLEKTLRSGSPNYQIKPSGNRDEYAPISFIEPYAGNNKNAIGFDLLTNPFVKPALLRAKSSGDLAMTGKLSLVQDEGRFIPASVMYIPIYDTSKPLTTAFERHNALIGWVSGPFRINDFMSSLSHELLSDVGVSIYAEEGESVESRIYGKKHDPEASKGHLKFNKVKTLEYGVAKWVHDMHKLP